MATTKCRHVAVFRGARTAKGAGNGDRPPGIMDSRREDTLRSCLAVFRRPDWVVTNFRAPATRGQAPGVSCPDWNFLSVGAVLSPTCHPIPCGLEPMPRVVPRDN